MNSIQITALDESKSSKKFSRDHIIKILGEEFPLSIANIHQKIKEKNDFDVTYQAIRKSLNSLVELKVVSNKNKKFSLSEQWINDNKKFAELIEHNYFKTTKPRTEVELAGNIKVYTFDNLLDKDKFWVKLENQWIEENTENQKIERNLVWSGAHCWWVFGQLDNEDQLIDLLLKSKMNHYWLNTNDTYLDKWATKYYNGKNLFYKAIKGSAEENENYLLIYGDNIMQSSYPAEIVKKLNEFYSKIKDISDLNLKELMQILKQKIEVNITIMDNPAIANKLRQDILSHFKK